MRAEVSSSLETELAKFSATAGGSQIRARQLIAFRFYLKDVVDRSAKQLQAHAHGYTNYLTLMNELLDWQRQSGERVLLVTFNYDTLLEQAAIDVVSGWNPHNADLDSYVSRDDFRIFKVHGSTDWVRVCRANIRNQGRRSAMDLAAQGYDFSDAQIMGESHSRTATAEDTMVSVPALAVPMAGKTDFECPARHLTALEVDLPNVRHVLMIGWRAAEPHAVSLLDGGGDPQHGLFPSFDLGIVSWQREGVSEVFQNLGDVARKGHAWLGETGGFEAFTRDISHQLSRLLDNPESVHRLNRQDAR